MQNGFIKAFVNLRGFDTRRKFSSWIYRIVHNEAVNEIKKGSKLINWSAEKWKRQEGDSEDMVDKMSEQEVVALLEKNLGKMELKYKEVLVLYYLEEKSYEEISEILRVPMGTVGVRISRAKIQLKKIYEENE